MPVLAALFHIAYIYARRINNCADLVVEVNPRHLLFYKRMLGFSEYGAERLDPRVRAPAVLLRLDLALPSSKLRKWAAISSWPARASLYPYFFSRARKPESSGGSARSAESTTTHPLSSAAGASSGKQHWTCTVRHGSQDTSRTTKAHHATCGPANHDGDTIIAIPRRPKASDADA